MQIIGFILTGLLAGALSGITGIGGGIVVIPMLIYAFGFSERMAQGTTLALLVPPIGIMAAWTYYQRGFVDIKVAAILAVGFVVGSMLSARFAVDMNDGTIRRIFAVMLMVVAIKMFFANPSPKLG